MRRKAARQVASKCALAARVDSFHESLDGKVGMNLRAEVESKFDKWQEPPPVKQVKPLPAPIDQARKKRGGRRLVIERSFLFVSVNYSLKSSFLF